MFRLLLKITFITFGSSERRLYSFTKQARQTRHNSITTTQRLLCSQWSVDIPKDLQNGKVCKHRFISTYNIPYRKSRLHDSTKEHLARKLRSLPDCNRKIILNQGSNNKTFGRMIHSIRRLPSGRIQSKVLTFICLQTTILMNKTVSEWSEGY